MPLAAAPVATLPSLAADGCSSRRGSRRAGLSEAVPSAPSARAALALSFKGKGAKYGNKYAGPWISALASMPPPVPTGAKRARAGLADVPLRRGEWRSSAGERAARALVSILPYESCAFVLHDSPDAVAARSHEANAQLMVDSLESFGVSSLEAAYGVLGRLFEWAATRSTPGRSVGGSDVKAYLGTRPSGSRHSDYVSLVWLRDWCGIDLAVRSAATRGARSGGVPSKPHDKESFSFSIVLGLEWLSHHHPSPFVRGQAAAWLFLALHALRVEQSLECVINSFVSGRVVDGAFVACGDGEPEATRVTCASAALDKNPDQAKQRPRPVWGVFDGFCFPGSARAALAASLVGAEEVGCILRDTDSPSGDPLLATRWIAAGIASRSRVDASLHSLLQLPPISLSASAASRYHGHSPKRFLLNVAESAASFDAVDANHVGRFSGSTAQAADLEPVAAMLRRHELQCSVLPAIYGSKAHVDLAFARLVRLHRVLVAVAERRSSGELSLPAEGGWGVFAAY